MIHTLLRILVLGVFSLFAVFGAPCAVRAYYNNMPATFLHGQSDFLHVASSSAANTYTTPSFVSSDGQRFIVTDTGAHRVLIYNSVPTTPATGADVVVGQTNFTNHNPDSSANTVGCGFFFVNDTSLSYTEGAAVSDGTHLIVSDSGQNRVLIYNDIPKTSGACPSIVVGQNSLTATASAVTRTGLDTPTRAFVNQNKLFVVDQQNSRVLIFNSLPTSSGAAADVVVGQANFTSKTTATTAQGFDNPHGAATDGQHLFVADSENHRVLIFNTIPTSNNATADVVLGQANFTANVTNVFPTSTNIGYPEDVWVSHGRLFVSDALNHRVLIWNQIPTQNNQAADIVIGQTDFTTNQNDIDNTSLNTPGGIFESNDTLYVADTYNNRIVGYLNQQNGGLLELNNQVQNGANGLSRLSGVANANDDNYTVKSVSYSINGGGEQTATPATSFGQTQLGFSFDFDQKANNNQLDGFTASVVATSSNNDRSDKLFYFLPFNATFPAQNAHIDNPLPSFEFSVNQQNETLRKNLDSYELEIKPEGSDWMTYIGPIPVDYIAAKTGDQAGVQKLQQNGGDTDDNGVLETADYTVEYSNNSAHIKVTAKDPSRTAVEAGGSVLNGQYRWKVSAIDQMGHYEETPEQVLYVGALASAANERFPLALLSISGAKNINASTDDLAHFHAEYSTSSVQPIFYGITDANATVTLQMRDEVCTNGDTCTQQWQTVANTSSRFGIDIPPGVLQVGHTYTTHLTAVRDGNTVELPDITLHVR